MACLDENELTALLEHRLGEGDLARIDDHVASCAACRRLVAELERPGTTALAFANTEAAPGARDLAPLADALARSNAERRVGTTLADKWTLERVLGMGGMAQVFAATHRNGKKVAIKVLRPELCADPSILKRFLQEGYAANKVEHRGAVSVLDDGVGEDGSAFLVMELLDGETLGQRLAHERRLPAAEVVRVARAILDVLRTAHGKGIVHRDIKPENVFVEASGDVRLLDFGIARVRELTRARGGRTEAGAILGTPSFMPPEQARGLWDEVDARSDVWAVGATMYTLLTGKPVRSGQTLQEELLAAMTKPVPPLRKALAGVDAALGRVVDKALAMERGARFATAEEMLVALDGLAVARSGSRARSAGTWGALVALAVGAVVLVAITRPGGQPVRADDAARIKAARGARTAEESHDETATAATAATATAEPTAKSGPIPPRRPAPATTAAEAAATPSPAVSAPAPTPTDTPPSAPAPPAREVLDRRR